MKATRGRWTAANHHRPTDLNDAPSRSDVVVPVVSRQDKPTERGKNRKERGRRRRAAVCVFRRNMGLFPFATRFARASQLAFVASPPTNTQIQPLVPPRGDLAFGSARAYPPFSSGVRAVIRTVVFARMYVVRNTGNN